MAVAIQFQLRNNSAADISPAKRRDSKQQTAEFRCTLFWRDEDVDEYLFTSGDDGRLLHFLDLSEDDEFPIVIICRIRKSHNPIQWRPICALILDGRQTKRFCSFSCTMGLGLIYPSWRMCPMRRRWENSICVKQKYSTKICYATHTRKTNLVSVGVDGIRFGHNRGTISISSNLISSIIGVV